MSRRINRVNDLIQEELSKILLKEVEFPKDTLVTLTRADCAPNLSTTKIFISVIPNSQLDKVLRILNRRIYDIQQSLNKCLNMRPIPRIIFYKEKQTTEAARVEEVLERLKKE